MTEKEIARLSFGPMSQKNDCNPFSIAGEESLTYVKLDPIYFVSL